MKRKEAEGRKVEGRRDNKGGGVLQSDELPGESGKPLGDDGEICKVRLCTPLRLHPDPKPQTGVFFNSLPPSASMPTAMNVHSYCEFRYFGQICAFLLPFRGTEREKLNNS